MSIVVNNWRMDSSLNALIHSETGETRRLGEYHFILLETLAKNADTVLSRSFLMTEVWKNRIVGGNSMPTAIHALRMAIDDDGKQQEIIKTIPKKGYLFNQNYLAENIDHNLSVVDEHNVATPEKTTSHCADEAFAEDKTSLQVRLEPVPEAAPDASNKHITSDKKRALSPVLKVLSVIAVAVSLFAAIYFIKVPSAPKTSAMPQLVKENTNNSSRITVYHLYDPDIKKRTSTAISPHISSGIQQIEPLLATHKATMTLYYRESLNKFAMDIILTNQCNDSWQLALSFDRWQNKDDKMSSVIFEEVEKTLNEIPKCK